MHPLSDMLIRIKNAQAAGQERLVLPYSKLRWEVAKVLKESGFVKEWEKKKKKIHRTEQPYLELQLPLASSLPAGRQALAGIKIISKPSRRLYIKADEIRPVVSGYGIALLSTSRGIMTGAEARKQKLGGEFLAEIW